MRELTDKLYETRNIEKSEFLYMLENRTEESDKYLFEKARKVSTSIFGNKVYIRGLIEFTNYCRNNCYYCGIRCDNMNAQRYRLEHDDILNCCDLGYKLGFRTFVLQGGEDLYYDDEKIRNIVRDIKKRYNDCAVTLSIGEKSFETYLKYYQAGADRYLLRHETAEKSHYSLLHPKQMSLESRMECLYNLKKIGFQTGCGFMVGSPYQTNESIAEDIMFIKDFKPHMVGIGPFISHKDTPFNNFENGNINVTLFLLSVIRLLLPNVLLPATTALGTLDSNGREKGVLAGANVLMPNLSPVNVRKKYSLYDNKICTGEEAAECNICLRKRMKNIGYEIVEERGDYNEKA